MKGLLDTLIYDSTAAAGFMLVERSKDLVVDHAYFCPRGLLRVWRTWLAGPDP